MPKSQPTTKQNSEQAILRMSSAIEDAPYAIDTVEVLNTRVTASCGSDGGMIEAASCGDIKTPRKS